MVGLSRPTFCAQVLGGGHQHTNKRSGRFIWLYTGGVGLCQWLPLPPRHHRPAREEVRQEHCTEVNMRLVACLLVATFLLGCPQKFDADEEVMSGLSMLGLFHDARGSREQAFEWMKPIKAFGLISVTLDGTARELGLDSEVLEDYIRLRVRNDFVGLRLVHMAEKGGVERVMSRLRQEETQGKEQRPPEFSEAEQGYLTCYVGTAGEAYPIAYYVECRSDKSRGLEEGTVSWERGALGVATRSNLLDVIKHTLDQMIVALAIDFFRERGELDNITANTLWNVQLQDAVREAQEQDKAFRRFDEALKKSLEKKE